MINKISALALFLVLAIIFPAHYALADLKVEFEGRYWFAELDAKGRAVETGIGTEIDFKSDLGIGDEDIPEGRLRLHLTKNHSIRVAYLQVDYGGDKVLSRTIEFNGETIPASTRVVSDLDISYLRVGWIWQFINVDEGKFRLGMVLEGVGFWADAVLNAPGPAITEQEKFAVGLPAVGAALDINPGKAVNIFAEATGMYVGDYGYFFDAEAGIKIIPVKNFTIFGGYRYIRVNAEDEPDFLKVQLDGPFAGANLRF